MCTITHFIAANLMSANVGYRLPSIITVPKTCMYVFNTYLLN